MNETTAAKLKEENKTRIQERAKALAWYHEVRQALRVYHKKTLLAFKELAPPPERDLSKVLDWKLRIEKRYTIEVWERAWAAFKMQDKTYQQLYQQQKAAKNLAGVVGPNRYFHLALCFLQGRTYRQTEPRVKKERTLREVDYGTIADHAGCTAGLIKQWVTKEFVRRQELENFDLAEEQLVLNRRELFELREKVSGLRAGIIRARRLAAEIVRRAEKEEIELWKTDAAFEQKKLAVFQLQRKWNAKRAK